MFGILISFGAIAILIYSLFNALLASKAFIVLIALFEGYLFLMSRVGQPNHLEAFTAPLDLNSDEVAVIKKYHDLVK